MAFATVKLPIILFGAAQLLKHAARRHPEFKARVKEHNLVAQIMTRDEEIGRWYEFNNGVITTGAGLHAKPDIKLMFKNAKIGASLLMPPINWLDQINAQKDFILTVDGPEYLTNWFAQTLMMSQSAGLKYGTKLRRRHHALLQHDQRRAGLRRRQGRQDRAHDADRPRPKKTARRGPSRPRAKSSRRRARPRWRRTARTRSRSSIRPTACSIR